MATYVHDKNANRLKHKPNVPQSADEEQLCRCVNVISLLASLLPHSPVQV